MLKLRANGDMKCFSLGERKFSDWEKLDSSLENVVSQLTEELITIDWLKINSENRVIEDSFKHNTQFKRKDSEECSKILGISVRLPNLKKETTPPLIVAPTFILEVSNADHCLTNKGWE